MTAAEINDHDACGGLAAMNAALDHAAGFVLGEWGSARIAQR